LTYEKGAAFVAAFLVFFGGFISVALLGGALVQLPVLASKCHGKARASPGLTGPRQTPLRRISYASAASEIPNYFFLVCGETAIYYYCFYCELKAVAAPPRRLQLRTTGHFQCRVAGCSSHLEL
jgi:hypothetical protein